MDGRRDDAGSGQLVAFLVGLALFAAVVAAALVYASHDEKDDEGEGTDLRVKATVAVMRLASTPGAPTDWDARGVGDSTALGLAIGEENPFELSHDKIALLTGSSSPATDRLPNLTGADGWSVHVRVEPLVFAEANGSVAGFPTSTLAYVSHREGDVDDSKSDALDSTGAFMEIAMLRELAFPFRYATASSSSYESRGDVHPDSQPDLLRELVPRLAGFDSATYSTSDEDASTWKIVRRGVDADASWWAGSASSRYLTTGKWASSTRVFENTQREHSLTIGTFDLSGLDDYAPIVRFSHWFDSGSPPPFNDEVALYVACLANCSALTEEKAWSTTSDAGSRASLEDVAVDLSAFEGGTIRLRLVYDRNSPSSRGLPLGEGWFVSELRFDLETSEDPPAYVSTLYENDLDYNTTSYEFLVVGSDVDHEAFLASDGYVRAAITDWVVAGGRLLVLGSEDADSAWLDGTFTVPGTPQSSSALVDGASDFTHPLVTSPRMLRVASLDWSAPSWSPSDDFVTVLVGEEGTHGDRVPVLSASSAPARFGGGLVLATARPGLAELEQRLVARDALANWLAYLLHYDLQGEAGDSIPARVAYGHASLMGVTHSPATGREEPVRVSVFVWR